MSRFERWILRRLLSKQLDQGPALEKRIAEVFAEVRAAYAHRYYEDNVFTQDTMLRECFEATQHKPAISAA
jgi:hypothetical protein